MWSLEVIKKMNSIDRNPFLYKKIADELNGFDYENHSFKILSSPLEYQGRMCNYLAPNTHLGKVVVNEMLSNPSQAFFIKELNVYIF
jgi:hypothetical protein